MQCPNLAELPRAPAEKSGWPWTEESTRLPLSSARKYPLITVVTPSFNQGEFLEETIRSILLQGYPNLEYLVLDGGSTDQSVEIIKKYSPWLKYWISKPDGGQSEAINRGLTMGSGEFAAWINSDDMLCKDALSEQAVRGEFDSDTVYVGDCVYLNENGEHLYVHRGKVSSLEDLLRIGSVWRAQENRGHIDQPAVLFPRVQALSVGGLNIRNHFTMDYEFWGDLLLSGAKFHYTGIRFGMFREHKKQKTQNMLRQTECLIDSATRLAGRAGCLSEKTKMELIADLEAYMVAYRKAEWIGSGRLAKMGVPRSIALPLRKLVAVLRQ